LMLFLGGPCAEYRVAGLGTTEGGMPAQSEIWRWYSSAFSLALA